MIGWLLEVITYGSIGALIGAVMHAEHIRETAKPCATHHEWRMAPHEQQPEPMMARTLGDVERWVM